MRNIIALLRGAALILLLASTLPSFAQIVINEYSCGNKSQHADATGGYEDWVELYNAGAASVNIGGWHLSDQKGQPLKWTIPAGTTINAGARRMFYCSSRDGLFSGQLHTNFKLTQSSGNEEICLTNAGGSFIDSLSLKKVRRNHSRGRTTDGAATWSVFETPTPNATNSGGKPEYVPQVQFSLNAGFYTGTQTLTLSCSQANTSIYYTTNGAIPTNTASATNFLYTGPISMPATRVIRARAFDNANTFAGSFTVTNSFFINEPATNYNVWSIVSNSMNTFFGNGNETMVSAEYFGTDGQRMFQMEGDVKRHGNDSWAFPQKGFRFYVRDDYGYANKIDAKLFPTSPRTDFDVVIIKAAGSDNFPDGDNAGRVTHNRDAYVQTLCEKFDLNVDVRRMKNAITYVNGQYWGIYESRERIDVDYTEYYYNNGEKWVDMLEYWGGLQIVAGSDTAWNNLFNYIINNSMANNANYNYAISKLDPLSLIDYIMLNTYTVNSDWINWNTAWWRGRKPGEEVRWRYKLWDQDNTFNLGSNYTGLPSTNNTASPCGVQSLSQYANTNNPQEGHIRIFNRLMQNPQFEQLYINRYADLINTAFYCPTMLTHFDTMIARLAPEIPRHATRWFSTFNQWNNTTVPYTRNQISGRCNNVIAGLGPCYSVTGPYPVTVNVSPSCAGTVKLNTTTPDQYPWSGNYYGGINITLEANPAGGWVFSHWQLVSHTPSPNVNADSIWLDLGNSGDSIVAVFTQSTPVNGQLTVNIVGNNPGVTTINGTPVTNGQVLNIPMGTSVAVNATPIPGCTFYKWELNNSLVYPVDTLESGSFCFRQNDTLTVIYDACAQVIDTNYLTVIIQQPGWGTVSINSIPVPAPITIPIPDNTLLNLVATPTAGYTFSNWQLANHSITPNNNAPSASFTITQDDTLYAIFDAPDTFSLTVLVNPGASGNVSVNGSTPPSYPATLQFVDGTVINLAATPLAGYNFINYTLPNHTLSPNSTTANASFTITQNDTLTAFFSLIPPDTFNLTVVVNPPASGNVSINGTTPPAYPVILQYVDGTLLNLAATANGGFSFSNYLLLHHSLTPNNTSANASFTITQDDTLVVNFIAVADTFDLTVLVTPPGGGNVNVNGTLLSAYPTTLSFAGGTLINIDAIQNGGFTFSNWTLLNHALLPNNTAQQASFTITQDDTLIANFAIIPNPDTFSLTVLINPLGAGDVSVNGIVPANYPTTFSFVDGTPVNLTALNNIGFTFSNYTLLHHSLVPNNTSVNASFNINQNDTLVANFTVNPDTFDLTVLVTPGGSGNVSINGNTLSTYPTTLSFVDGTLINASAIPVPGFGFVNWTLLNHSLNPNNTSTNVNFNITQDDTLLATFIDLPDTFNLVLNMVNTGNGSMTVNGSSYTTFPTVVSVVEGTTVNASQVPNSGFLFQNWTLSFGTLNPNNTATAVNFVMNQPDTLTAFYTIAPPDTHAIWVNVQPNIFAGDVSVAGQAPSNFYPVVYRFPEGTNVDFEAIGNTVNASSGPKTYVFDRYEFIYHNPLPNPNQPIVFINVQMPDSVTAYFVEQNLNSDTAVQVLAPTGFSPDGDGVNDFFKIFIKPDGLFFADYNLQIYNRWGQQVFESNNQGYDWNGNFGNKKCDIGIYTYTFTGKLTNGEEVFKKGAVTLLR
ncbi:MAG: CotH kinase family protein [Bacteroidetes bacterium]|nr:CotH kinase family protein [Bacteroidota bacterium]